MTTPAEAPLDPTALARFGRLELIARLVVEGVMSGLHKSPFKGFSVEFAEHRQYGPGDEIRHIDWRAFGKTDRYYVKEYEEETNLKAYLVVDSSGSMGYARPDGLEVRARAAARGVAGLPDDQPARRRRAGHVRRLGPRPMIPPRSAPGHFSVVCKALEETKTGGETPLSGILHALAERIQRRGLVVDPLRRVRRARRPDRRPCGTCGTGTTRCSSSTRSPPRRRSSRSAGPRGSATSNGSTTSSGSTRWRSARRTSSGSTPSAQTLKERIRAMDADYHRASTAEPVEPTLLDYLASRSRRRA